VHIRCCCAGDYRRLLRPQDALGQAMPRCRGFSAQNLTFRRFFWEIQQRGAQKPVNLPNQQAFSNVKSRGLTQPETFFQ
jgi:hypothetical protein